MADQSSKYLTDMKELPPEADASMEKVTNVSEPEAGKTALPGSIYSNVSEKRETVNTENNKDEKTNSKKDAISEEEDDDDNEGLEEETLKPFTKRDVFLGVINFLCIAAIIFLIVKFPQKAAELKNERVQMILNDSSLSYELSEVSQSKVKADELENRFVDESGIVSFVGELEKIKAETGLIQKISFTNQNAVEDKATGLFGIPVVVEFRGDFNGILTDIRKIHSLPYIVRAIKFDSVKDKDDPSMVNLKYGGFIYVNDKLGKD